MPKIFLKTQQSPIKFSKFFLSLKTHRFLTAMDINDHTLEETLKTITLEVIEEIFVNSTSPQEFEAELRWAASRRLIVDKVQFEESYNTIENDASYRVVTMKLSPFLLNYDYDETIRLSNLTWDFFINVDDGKLDFEDPHKINQLAEHSFIEIVDDYEDMDEFIPVAHHELLALIRAIDQDLPNSFV